MSGRVWSVRIPAPVRIQSVNQESDRAKSRNRKLWREAAYGRIAAAHLPQRLDRIRIDVEIRFTSIARRDNSNYHNIAKPIQDACGPGRKYMRDGKPVLSRGHGIIRDDTAEFLHCTDCPHITFGEPVRADPRWPLGLVILTVTDLSGGDDA